MPSRLTLPGLNARVIPSRITSCPRRSRTLDRKLNFVSITPGTSLTCAPVAGTAEEAGPDLRAVGGPLAVSRGGASQGAGRLAEFESFAHAIDAARRDDLDCGLAEAFVAAVRQGR